MKLLLSLLASISILSAADKQYVDVTGWVTDDLKEQQLLASINEAKKDCRRGDIPSCQLIGEYYQLKAKENPNNYFEAFKAYQTGCQHNDPLSCFNAAVSYNVGLGVRQDTDTAWELFGKACDLGSQEGCTAFAAYSRAAERRK